MIKQTKINASNLRVPTALGMPHDAQTIQVSGKSSQVVETKTWNARSNHKMHIYLINPALGLVF